MTTFEFFSQYFQLQLPHLVTIYTKTTQGCHDLNFFYREFEKNQWIVTNRRLNDTDFFRELYQQHGVSRNSFIEQLDNVMPTGQYKKHYLIDVPNSSIQRSIQYVVIHDIEQYLKSALFSA
jgi:hypothetical protein